MYVRICTDRFISYKYLVFSFETFNFISLFFFCCVSQHCTYTPFVVSFMHVCIRVCRDIWSLGCVLYELCTLRHPVSILSPIILLVLIQRLIPQLSLSWCFSNSGACPPGTGGGGGVTCCAFIFLACHYSCLKYTS